MDASFLTKGSERFVAHNAPVVSFTALDSTVVLWTPQSFYSDWTPRPIPHLDGYGQPYVSFFPSTNQVGFQGPTLPPLLRQHSSWDH